MPTCAETEQSNISLGPRQQTTPFQKKREVDTPKKSAVREQKREGGKKVSFSLGEMVPNLDHCP